LVEREVSDVDEMQRNKIEWWKSCIDGNGYWMLCRKMAIELVFPLVSIFQYNANSIAIFQHNIQYLFLSIQLSRLSIYF